MELAYIDLHVYTSLILPLPYRSGEYRLVILLCVVHHKQ